MGEVVVAEQRAVAAVQPSNATTFLQVIERAASNPQADIEKMERLFAMHQKMVAQEAEAAFNAAMSRAQARILPVANNAENSQTNSRYAKLAAINEAITPIYTAEGLSISFDTEDSPKEGYQRTVAIVSHAAGHSRRYRLDMPLDDVGAKGTVNKTKVHATGSTSSYARRYLVCMIFNVTTFDDDDGQGAGKGLPEGIRADFETAIDALADTAQAQPLWKDIAAACQKHGDKGAYDALKKRMSDKVAALKGAK